MKKFIEEHELEVLMILVTVLGITKWWIPKVQGFEKIYAASHWVLSYDYGFIRRGLVGTIMKIWVPIVTIEDIHHTAFIAYCIFLVFLLIVFYVLLRYKDKHGQLFRLILIFLANPATIAMLARDLGRFDLFLIIITFILMTLLLFNKHVWLVPILMVIAMFIHEGFLILFAPTILAAIIFVYLWKEREKKLLVTLVFSVISVAAVFLFIYKYGRPAMGYDKFWPLIQSRAAFNITELSIRECYFSVVDHYNLASSSLYDAGSIANFFAALLIMSPVILILINLWTHAFRDCGAQHRVCKLLLLATLSGLMVIPIATDYGRWLSGVIFCNFFAIFFLISKGIIKVEELTEYKGDSFAILFVPILLIYLLFGPLHDWNPYPYTDNLIFSAISITVVLFFDIGFYLRWQSLSKVKYSGK
jgi:hypothetical protein